MYKVIGFHNPDEANGFLSNWYLSDFTMDGIAYSSMEQYMMYQKAVLFGDKEIADQILETTNVGKIKALGRAVKGYNDVIWNGQNLLGFSLMRVRDMLKKNEGGISGGEHAAV